jgi:hypothetical protein
MAHFAQLDENNVVLQVIVVSNNELLDNGVESEAKGIAFCESLFPGTAWLQTSYSGSIRKNYAGSGFTYDAQRNAYIPPQPFSSWTLNETTCQWVAPVPHPQDGQIYVWNETAQGWALATPTPDDVNAGNRPA